MCEICWKLAVFIVIIYCFIIFIAEFKQVNAGKEICQVFCLQHVKSTSMVESSANLFFPLERRFKIFYSTVS